jgi:hypothetical protein
LVGEPERKGECENGQVAHPAGNIVEISHGYKDQGRL